MTDWQNYIQDDLKHSLEVYIEQVILPEQRDSISINKDQTIGELWKRRKDIAVNTNASTWDHEFGGIKDQYGIDVLDKEGDTLHRFIIPEQKVHDFVNIQEFFEDEEETLDSE